jgi:hypothetical protein
VGDPHRRVGGVHALAARATGAEGIDAQVLGFDLDVHFLGFGQHGDRGRGGVDPAAGFGDRHALHPVDARFVPQAAVDALALDRRGHFLEAADAGLALREHVDLPAPALRVARVHPEQVAGEERRFITAGARADFDDDVAFVVRVLRDEENPQVIRDRGHALLEARGFLAGERGHLGVAGGGQLARLRQFFLQVPVVTEPVDGRLNLSHRLGMGAVCRLVRLHGRIADQTRQFFIPRVDRLEFLEHLGCHLVRISHRRPVAGKPRGRLHGGAWSGAQTRRSRRRRRRA